MTPARSHHEPGISFGMPESEYLADPSLSASGICDLCISPLDYWINSPLNPDFEPEETEAKVSGTAFHKRILEGKAAFDAAYVPEISLKDYPGALASGKQLRDKCAELGLAKSGSLEEMSARIRAVDSTAVLWTEIEADHAIKHKGKEFLKPQTMWQIELAAMQLEANQETAALLQGGFAEVSIFWIDEQSGVHMKARLDYLKPGLVVDLKTFANSRGKRLALVVASALAEYGYGVKAHVYLEAARVATELPSFFPAYSGGEWMQNPPVPLSGDNRFIFLFQQTGRVPNVVLREFKRAGAAGANNYFEITHLQFRGGVEFYKQCMDRWGPAQPWAEPATLEAFEDEDFPSWAFG